MTKKVNVKISWSEWKMNSLPQEFYSTVAKFDDGKFPREAWSVKLQIGDQVQENVWNGVAEFLSADAPYILKPGVQFELMEGIRAAATVTVV